MSEPATYTLLPWVREGFRPTTGDEPGTMSVEMTLASSGPDESTTSSIDTTLSMYGPGEVTGIDRRQIVRTEPEPQTSNFSKNHFPVVEFDRPDLPWLFSPTPPTDDGDRLDPWLALITVERGDGVEVHPQTSGSGTVVEIGGVADPVEELPDLEASWAWAHAQVVGTDDVEDALETRDAETTLSRLVSPRLLEPRTDYLACVVPTYERGRLAGLGQELPPRDDEDHDPFELAWDLEAAPSAIRLPVYYYWEFSTASGGDFRSLVQRLEPRVLEDLGIRQVDVGDPGPATLEQPGEVVSLEGALRSVDLSPEAYDVDLQSELANILDEASGVSTESLTVEGESTEETPTHGPPIYGQWPPAAPTVPDADDDGEPVWLRDLVVDPRYRVPAGFGTEVVQHEHEQLMASAWKQVGEIRAANKRLRQARLSREASASLYADLEGLDAETALLFTEAVHGKILDEGATVATAIERTRLPKGALSPAFRRIARPSGPLARRLGGLSPEAIVEGLNDGTIDPGDDGSPADGAQMLPADVVDVLCQEATDAVEDARHWNPLGDHAGQPPSTIIHLLGQQCQQLRNRLSNLEAAGSVIRPVSEELGAFREGLDRICGVKREAGALEQLETALADDDAPEAFSAIVTIYRNLDRLTSVHDRLDEWARTEQPPGNVFQRILQLGGLLEAFGDRLGILTIAVFETVLWGGCSVGRESLGALEGALAGESDLDPAVTEAVETLRSTCERLCGTHDDLRGVLGELTAVVHQGDRERTRSGLALALALIRDGLEALGTVATAQRSVPEITSPLYSLTVVCTVFHRLLETLENRLEQTPADPFAPSVAGRVCPVSEPPEPDALDLGLTAQVVTDAVDPATTIPERLEHRLGGISLSDREEPLEQILAHPEFPQPMYDSLADRSQEYFLPGVDEVDRDSVGLVETNPAFVEAYVTGLNHEMARELRWHQYPTDMRGTYFRQFWDPEGRDPPLEGEEKKDIDYVHHWRDDYGLGGNYAKKMAEKGAHEHDIDPEDPPSQLVLFIRGEVFKRYPNTTVYAAKSVDGAGDDPDRVPDLPDPGGDPADGEGTTEHPLFRGTLESDIAFFGFDLTVEEGNEWFFVLEEPPSEPSFGVDTYDGDTDPPPDDEWEWSNITTADVDERPYLDIVEEPSGPSVPDDVPESITTEWNRNAAHVGTITWQQPYRVAIHGEDMLPDDPL